MQALLTPLATHLTATRILRPTDRALHIGMRNGFLGVFLREYLGPKFLEGVTEKAIERTQLWQVYDRYWTGDAFSVLANESREYDMIVVTDWIEHMEKNNALALLRLAHEKSKRLIFSVENRPGLTRWNPRDLAEFLGKRIAGDDISWGAWEAP